MAALGGVLAAAILKVVAGQIGSAIGGQIKLKKNFDKDLKKMKMALESVEAVLQAAERQCITDEPTLLWLKRLTNAMYDISSIIDEFEADTLPSARKLSLKKHLLRFFSCLPIGPKIPMANQMKIMREELKEITDNHQSFTLRTNTNAIHPSIIDIRETSSTMEDKEHIIGRMDEKEKILVCLSEDMTNDFTVLPIYGIGGLGKTTLAKLVFNNSQFRDYSQVWIYVSQTFDLKKIGNSVISQLSKEKIQYTEMQMIHSFLRELLANKKILIVLDDLWEGNKSHLDKLMDMLKVGESGKAVVILTTRSKGIAEKIATIQSHKLASLTDDMCWTIIKQKSNFKLRDDQKELEQIGKDIANKCGGVALAAQSLGHMLNSLTFDEWESMRDNEIWNVSLWLPSLPPLPSSDIRWKPADPSPPSHPPSGGGRRAAPGSPLPAGRASLPHVPPPPLPGASPGKAWTVRWRRRRPSTGDQEEAAAAWPRSGSMEVKRLDGGQDLGADGGGLRGSAAVVI